jgi:molecular chaperone GrpE
VTADSRTPRVEQTASPSVDEADAEAAVRENRAEPQVTELEPEASLEGLQARLQEAETKREEYLRDLQRLAADFDNYRKRALREQESLVARAHERLVRELLPVVDDLERALEAAAKHEEAKLEEGVRLVYRELEQVLAREGLVEIETDGRFDPHVHEALLAQPSEAEEGSVIQVVQKGYRLGDRVLRPARVVVASPPADTPPAEATAGDGGAPESDPNHERAPGDSGA